MAGPATPGKVPADSISDITAAGRIVHLPELGIPDDDGAGRTLAVHRNRLILLPLSNCYSDGVGPRTFRRVPNRR